MIDSVPRGVSVCSSSSSGYDLEHLHGKSGTISEWKKIKKYCPVKGWVLNKKDSYKLLLINCEAVIRL